MGLIVVVSFGHAYLFMQEKGKHTYIAKLNDLATIAEKMSLPQNEAKTLVLNLVSQRSQKTRYAATKELMELILFDPDFYFSP